MNPTASTLETATPSVRSRVLASIMSMSGVREKQFHPARFTGSPSKASDYAPPRAVVRRLRVTEEQILGWPVFHVAPRSGGSARALYLHGGAWAAEIRTGHWTFIAELAERTGRTFVVPIFPLVPSVTHDDVIPVLQEIWASLEDGEPVALLGDSAGATMALNLLRSLGPGARRPDVSVLLSPHLDLTLSHPEIATVAPRDPLLRADHLRELGELYAGDAGIRNPAANPMVSDLARLGDVSVFTGTRDIMNPDARRFADLATNAPGTTVSLVEMSGMLHDWMLMPIPEARTARDAIVDLLMR
ncbi:alpha/beta hydrolase fold domain-containing protein [Microbacterium sp. PMB16]|uniref:alpha/beta hydrolase fold domain-containing protein n=1 Tax=Microbacterium sp. PMB16 TaxID=3120157 RepID=UPI003F4B1527